MLLCGPESGKCCAWHVRLVIGQKAKASGFALRKEPSSGPSSLSSRMPNSTSFISFPPCSACYQPPRTSLDPNLDALSVKPRYIHLPSFATPQTPLCRLAPGLQVLPAFRLRLVRSFAPGTMSPHWFPRCRRDGRYPCSGNRLPGPGPFD